MRAAQAAAQKKMAAEIDLLNKEVQAASEKASAEAAASGTLLHVTLPATVSTCVDTVVLFKKDCCLKKEKSSLHGLRQFPALESVILALIISSINATLVGHNAGESSALWPRRESMSLSLC
jgi:hypothetical protein